MRSSFENVKISIFENAFATKPTEVSLGEVLEAIRTGVYASQTRRARELFQELKVAYGETRNKKCDEPTQYDIFKKQMPAFTISGTFSKRKATDLVAHSGFLQADLDKIGPKLDQVRKQMRTDPHVAFGFISPSGEGLKLGLRIDGSRHREACHAAEAYFNKTYGLTIDKACKDVSRLCFVSHDPELWITSDASQLPVPDSPNLLQCTDDTEGTEATEDTEVIPVEWLFSVHTMEDALRISSPDRIHDNNPMLFHFARALKALEKQQGKYTPQALQAAFDRWYSLTDKKFLRPGQTKEDYMFEFLNAYSSAKYPLGSVTIPKAWKLAQELPLPVDALQFEKLERRLLVALCYQLQIIAGEAPFYLSARTCATLFKHENHSTAAKWLRSLCVLEIIREVEKGSGKRASRYRYLRPSGESGRTAPPVPRTSEQGGQMILKPDALRVTGLHWETVSVPGIAGGPSNP